MTKVNRFSTRVKNQPLSEQVADAIQTAVLNNEFKAGDALPTEPELSQAFGVSRAVIRDATRLLIARGLVEAQHGRGVFVTDSQTAAFGDALLLALQRAGATVWDVEQFEQTIFPEVCALAAQAANDDDLAHIRSLIALYDDPQKVNQLETFPACIEAIFNATHNQVWQLLARPLLNLHSVRNWDAPPDSDPDLGYQMDQRYLNALINTITTRDPAQVRQTVAKMMQLPPQAEKAMRETAVGDIPVIPAAGNSRTVAAKSPSHSRVSKHD